MCLTPYSNMVSSSSSLANHSVPSREMMAPKSKLTKHLRPLIQPCLMRFTLSEEVPKMSKSSSKTYCHLSETHTTIISQLALQQRDRITGKYQIGRTSCRER